MAIPAAVLTRPLKCTLPGLTITVTATASSAAKLPGNGSVMRVVNEGANQAYIAVGGKDVAATLPVATTTATLTDSCAIILAGADCLFTIDPTTETFISAICRAAGTATLVVYTGEGL